MRDGEAPSLTLDTREKLVLGIGTTLGVVLFCAVPVIGLARSGFRLRAHFDLRTPSCADWRAREDGPRGSSRSPTCC